MKKHVLITAFICFAFVGCQKRVTSTPFEVIEIELDNATVATSNIFDNLTPIALETTDSSFIDALASVKLTPKHIFVRTDNTIKQFDRNGRFIKNIGQKGQAGNEYTGITDFILNEPAKQIDILDRKQKKILTFDYDGNYIKSTPIATSAWQLYKPNSTTTLTYSGNECDVNNTSKFNAYSENQRDSFFPIDEQRSKFLHIHTPRNLYTLINNEAIFFEAFNDTIYRLDKQQASPKYVLSYNGKNLPASFFTEKNYANIMEFFQAFNARGCVNTTYDVTEGDTKLVFTCYYEGNKHVNIYDKTAQQTQSSKTFTEDILMQNVSLPFDEEDFVLWGSDGEVAFWVQPEWLLENKDRILSSKLQAITSSLKEDDNPILLVGDIR